MEGGQSGTLTFFQNQDVNAESCINFKFFARWSLENAASLVFDKRLNWDQAWGEMMVRDELIKKKTVDSED